MATTNNTADDKKRSRVDNTEEDSGKKQKVGSENGGGAIYESHGGRLYVKKLPSPEDAATTMDVNEFVREATADFDKVIEDLKNGSTFVVIKKDQQTVKSVSFYGKEIQLDDDYIELNGRLNHVDCINQDFLDIGTHISEQFNLYSKVQDYGDDEGGRIFFRRTGNVGGIGSQDEECQLKFDCTLFVEYNHSLKKEVCAKILGDNEKVDSIDNCFAMNYSIKISFVPAAVLKRQ
jgi:hypothetical protein